MAGLLRRAARCQAALPLRGSVAKGPIKPIGPNFPIASEKAMGPNGWMRGTYHFWSLSKPFRGSVYQTPWVAGGIHNPTIDPVIHFNTQDRFQTMTAWEFIKCFLYNMLTARVWLVMVATPVSVTMFFVWLEHRREPNEIFMDREEYWKNFNDFYYGIYFDHHHYSHMMCQRRAHKWGYAGLDITLEDHHH
ncbi:Hypothetical protein SCF082_LOCUS15593 [Durusdinium trenchii]|uniref:Uncharacterized protein n=1 Tax=Durusdinium trenchii TaxID=1381693 RepID=A0ABP0K643_9DINO